MNTPTPESDADSTQIELRFGLRDFCYGGTCRKLERERDEAMNALELMTAGREQDNCERLEERQERDRLRKVCDMLANALRCADNSFFGHKKGQAIIDDALAAYNNLPHVKERSLANEH